LITFQKPSALQSGALPFYLADSSVSRRIQVETTYAVYLLNDPEHPYSRFYHGYRVARVLLSTAREEPNASLEDVDCTEEELKGAVSGSLLLRRRAHCSKSQSSILSTILKKMHVGMAMALRAHPLIKEALLLDTEAALPIKRRARKTRPPRHVNIPYDVMTIDANVLKKENLTQTHVTPLIYRAVKDFFNERLMIVGVDLGRPAVVDNSDRHRAELILNIDRARLPAQNRRLITPRRSPTVTVEGVDYMVITRFLPAHLTNNREQVGDIILIHDKDVELPNADSLPEDARIEHYFMYEIYGSKLVRLTAASGSQKYSPWTLVRAPPTLCIMHIAPPRTSTWNLPAIAGSYFSRHTAVIPRNFPSSLSVARCLSPSSMVQRTSRNASTHYTSPGDCTLPFSSTAQDQRTRRFMYHDTDPSFVDHPKLPPRAAPGYCPTCDWMTEREMDPAFKTRSGARALHTRGGNDYHVNDYILVKNTGGKLDIGDPWVGIICRITEFLEEQRHIVGVLLRRQVDFKIELQAEDDIYLDEVSWHPLRTSTASDRRTARTLPHRRINRGPYRARCPQGSRSRCRRAWRRGRMDRPSARPLRRPLAHRAHEGRFVRLRGAAQGPRPPPATV
jgi:hypothetical protein